LPATTSARVTTADPPAWTDGADEISECVSSL